MSAINLTLTRDFRAEDTQILRTDLAAHLEVGEPGVLFLKAAETPSLIQLLGDALSWKPLVVVATIYVSAFAKKAGDATWDQLVSWWRREETQPVMDVARALLRVAHTVDGRVMLEIGVDVPDARYGTVMSIPLTTPEEVAHALALFVARSKDLSEAMNAEVAAGRTPFGPASIELQDDGSLVVRWVTQTDFLRYELRLPVSDSGQS